MFLAVGRVARALGRGLGRGEQLSDALDVAGSNRSGEEAVVIMWTASPERHQVPRRDRWRLRIGKPSMRTFIRIGIDLAKNFFQVHALEREGAPAVTRKLSRGKVLAFFAQTAPCRVGMEACGSSHYWAREIRAPSPRCGGRRSSRCARPDASGRRRS